MKKSTLFLLCALVALVFASCKKEDPLSALELKFSQPSVTIDEGGDYNLGKLLLITPQNVADTLTVNWKSADPSIAQMVSKKWVLGVSMGETTITAESHGKSASIKVIVNELPITGLTIKDKYSGSVNVPIALDGVTLDPSGASLGRINWNCSSDKVTFVYDSENRQWFVVASEAGTYSITAKAGDLEAQSAELSVTVKRISKINLSETSIPLLSEGSEKRTAKLTYTIEPEDASYKWAEWIVSGDDCIEFNDGDIRSKDGVEGTAVITVRHKAAAAGDVDVEAKCTVTVTKSAPVESFSLSVQSKTLKSGENFTLSVKDLSPATASAEYIRWECDFPDDVTLSAATGASCTVTAKAKDDKTVKVKAIAPNGYEKECTVTITTIPVQSISFNNGTDLIAFAGKTYNLPKVTVTPSNATKASDVEYTVSDAVIRAVEGESSVAYTVSNSVGSDVKTCTVTATCGGKSAQFVMYAVPSNYMSLITPESAYSEFGTFGMGEKTLKPTQLVKSDYKNSPVASKLKLRYGSTSGTATKAIIETETYSAEAEFSVYKYDYNYNIASSTPSVNKTNVTFKLVLSDMNDNKLVSGSMNTYFYNSVVKYTYETVQKKDNKIVKVSGDISPNETLNLNIVRDGSAQKIYAPAFTIYAEYYTNSGKSATKSFKASYSSRTDYYDVKEDVIRNMQIFSSNATKSKTGTVDFTVKFKK